jgi:hypothetical protein
MYVFWTLRKADQEYLEFFKMWCWGKNSWTERVTYEEVLKGVKEERNIPHDT